MNIWQKFKWPIYWLTSEIAKWTFKKLFFKNISSSDFKRLFGYTLELLPNETFINVIKLLFSTFRSKPSELSKFRLLKEALTHSIPAEQRPEVYDKAKIFFITLILWNITKRSLLMFRYLILLPFKMGVYSFIAFLFGIRPDYFLSFFDIFRFNLPGWTYNKLLELHLSWMAWFKNILQIKSINSDSDAKLELPKLFSNKETSTIESKPDTYFYLTKTQWLYFSVSVIAALGAYFGYTGGIPFWKVFEWESESENREANIDRLEKRIEKEPFGSQRAKAYEEELQKIHEEIRKSSWKNKLNPLNWFGWWGSTPAVSTEGINSTLANESPEERLARKVERATLRRDGTYRKLQSSMWDKLTFLSDYWKSHDELNLEQAEERVAKAIAKRDEILSSTKDTSPTHSDPEVQGERNKYFQRPEDETPKPPIKISRKKLYGEEGDNSFNESDIKSPIPKPFKSTIYSTEGANDSTETIRPAYESPKWSTNKIEDNIPSDVTASELTPLTNPYSQIEDSDSYTYPPKQRGVSLSENKEVKFSEYQNQPFAKGYNEAIDPSEINKNKETPTLFLGAKISDQIAEDLKKNK
jgi:hypothetical protein